MVEWRFVQAIGATIYLINTYVKVTHVYDDFRDTNYEAAETNLSKIKLNYESRD